MPIIRAVFGLLIYIFSLISLTSMNILIYQGLVFIIERKWVWITDYENTQAALFIILICVAIANYFIEDECKKSCGEKEYD